MSPPGICHCHCQIICLMFYGCNLKLLHKFKVFLEIMSEVKVKFENFNQVCRTCLQEVDLEINIFNYLLRGKLIAEILEFCSSLKVDADDKLPQCICSNCVVHLSEVYKHITRWQETNEALLAACKGNEFKASQRDDHLTIKIEELSDENVPLQDANIKNETDSKVLHERLLNMNIRRKRKQSLINFPPKETFRKRFYFCKMCNSRFETVEDRRKHRQTHAKHRCEFCNKQFLYPSRLARHTRTHTEEKPFECDKCGKKFAGHHSLQRHDMIHTGERPYICEVCGKGFIQLVTLQSHTKNHSHFGPCVCDVCGESFESQYLLRCHLSAKHREVIGESDHDQRDYLCSECGKMFRTKMHLVAHGRVHSGEKPFECGACSKRFATLTGCLIHRRTHTGVKPHACEMCGKAFTQKGSLKLHRRIHQNLREYECKECGKRFLQQAHLNAHMVFHSGERKFRCAFCEKSFAMKGVLIVHERIHTGEQPFQCEVCLKRFYDSSSMKKHRKKHGEMRA